MGPGTCGLTSPPGDADAPHLENHSSDVTKKPKFIGDGAPLGASALLKASKKAFGLGARLWLLLDPPLLLIGLVQRGHSPLRPLLSQVALVSMGFYSNLVMMLVPPHYWPASPCGQPPKQGPQGRLLECEVPERP